MFFYLDLEDVDLHGENLADLNRCAIDELTMRTIAKVTLWILVDSKVQETTWSTKNWLEKYNEKNMYIGRIYLCEIAAVVAH